MKKYKVHVPEVWVQCYLVEAESPKRPWRRWLIAKAMSSRMISYIATLLNYMRLAGMQKNTKRIWLDDVRPAPDGWIACRWPEDVIRHLKSGRVEEISLDHDLDDPLVVGQGYCASAHERTGYDVLLWIEEQVFLNNFKPPKINIHTANSSARKKMLAAVNKIESLISDEGV